MLLRVPMNAPVSRSSLGLLAAGGVAILLLGAFSRDPFSRWAATSSVPDQIPADTTIETAGEPELPAGLSPGLAEIVRLAQAHVSEEIILAYIQNSGETYFPTADEVLYLSDLGLSQKVIGALFKVKPSGESEKVAVADLMPAPRGAPPATNIAPGMTPVNTGLFYQTLAPYGTWTEAPDYGLCWQPTAETVNPDWRPYVDQGQWAYTANGWYWQSSYSWGWAPFHYGRWTKIARLGWVWVPDGVWAPAWVSWRIALDYSGWAPLPPGVALAPARGLTYHNQRVAADFDFGLAPSWFIFVNEGSLFSRDLPNSAVPASQTVAVYNRSLTVNDYFIKNLKVFNSGPGPASIAVADDQTPSIQIDRSPADNSAVTSVGQAGSGKDLEPVIAMISRGDAAAAPSIQGLVLPTQPPPPFRKVHRHHWAENNAAFSKMTSPARPELFNGRDFFPRAQAPGSIATRPPEPSAAPPPPEPARMMAAAVPIAAKSGK
jgi:hypothetical protein